MDFTHSERSLALQRRVEDFMQQHVYPVENAYYDEVRESSHPYRTPQVLQALKARARDAGLWNLFLSGAHGSGLSNLEYAPVKEIMGRVLWAPEIFNCSAPDTGNMEVLANYGTEVQQAQWLAPLMAGTIRSAFSMTEPAVASSDATNIQCEIRRDGDDYVINGRKWFTSGALNEDCTLLIVMGKSAPDHPERHKQQSMILVPKATPGVRIVRDITAFGYDDAPVGHPEIVYDNVRVPASNILLGEGRGFEIAQGRLGPGRIHHCMRLIGCAQRALELMCQRASTRVAFGRTLGEQGSVREDIAHSYCEIEQARLLTLKAADKMDREGNKAARDLIAAAKIVVPSMAARVIDRAIQVFGGAGVSQDTFLPRAYVYARFIRIGDGPDQVHLSAVGKQMLQRHGAQR
ncbi:acyl-CoA dehydrogenase family protein [Variovorax ginsengisoli]|uniref:Acyl-CoA dehydrogenase family protein n=1 Tax=Variovorax ginsengisoli TaxID=363844 RepID=A0ABT8SA23_9BURK|nr:acyl-CoA dehydrogenase family protein [Variovorax ginsengisoli]MDN8616583.1 acyl-CoA dehydrogenase family protein [Variovorax ginsengisoli]MDO1535753.1 acyl-CoA dehydrogenase family protein [Variovorax ginsengisoli]